MVGRGIDRKVFMGNLFEMEKHNLIYEHESEYTNSCYKMCFNLSVTVRILFNFFHIHSFLVTRPDSYSKRNSSVMFCSPHPSV